MDHRGTCHQLRWWDSINQSRMTATATLNGSDDEGDFEEEVEIPIHFEVCPTCDGRGQYVNPAIDSHGISPDEFAEDPDFAESYFAGHYDVRCEHCRGERVVPVPDDDKWLKRIEQSR